MKKYSLGMYEKAVPKNLSWKEKIFEAKNADYDFIEMSIDETDEKLLRLEKSEKEIRAFVNLMSDENFFVRSICLSAHRKYPLGASDKKTEARSLEILEKTVSLADRLGVRIVMLAGYDVYYEKSTDETRARFEKNLQTCVECASRAGVVLAFETMETPFMDTATKAKAYVDKIASPYLQIYPDLGNITNAAKIYEANAISDLEKAKGHLVAAHIKETLPGKYREVPFGKGHVDFEGLLKKCWSLGVRRYVTELWHTGDDWKERLHEAVSFSRAILDACERDTGGNLQDASESAK